MAQVFYYPPSSASSASTGTNGAPAPTSSTEIGGIDPSGNLKGVAVDSAGNLLTSPATLAPNAATASNQVLEIADLDAIKASTASIDTKTVLPASLGQKTSANSLAVVIASDQSAVPVSAASLPLPTGAATSANQTNGSQVTQITGAVPLPTGAATAALQTSGNSSLTSIANATAVLTGRLSGSLVPSAYDEVDLTYITVGNGIGQIGTAVYKLLGSTVKTVTLTYDGSDRLSTVVAT